MSFRVGEEFTKNKYVGGKLPKRGGGLDRLQI